ncbi:MAG TPA: helix-turn-helix domain-containing protein [Terriglobales bacterium]|nr:helix-turn-helix domain-containing protein [Terriglobales bacterium]
MQTMSVSKTARKLGVTVDAVYRLLYSGRLTAARKQDGKWRIPAQAVRARLRQRAK